MARNDNLVAKATKVIVVRVNGGRKIGMGHVYRTITIVNTLKDKYEFAVEFIINDDDAARKVLDSFSYVYSVLPYISNSSEELANILGRFDRFQSVVCLLDTQDDLSDEIEIFNKYNFAVILLLNKTRARLISAMNIYPLAHFDYLSLDWANYGGKVVGGGEYIPLTEPFLVQRETLRPIAARQYILVTMGGTDPNRLTIKIMDSLKEFASIVPIRVVLGHAFAFREDVHRLNEACHGRFELLENVDNMHELMAEAGLAITAIGITIYELGFLGVPAVLLSNYEHDSADEVELEKLGNVVSLGFFKHVSGNDILQAVESLWLDKTRRSRMSDFAFNITDGHGAERICKEIVSLRTAHGDDLFRLS